MKNDLIIVIGTIFSVFIFAWILVGLVLAIFEPAPINGDMNHDNELTIKDLSILAAQINNK